MQYLVIFACALVAASAGFVAPVAPIYAAQHLPVIGPNGVPVDTPAVQQATAEHLHHKVEAHVRNGDYATPIVAQAPFLAHHTGAFAHGRAAYPTTAVHPQSINGVPLETPEVVAAKADHFAAHAEAKARAGYPEVPFAYSGVSAYSTPIVAHSAYSAYPYAGHSAYLYRHRRGVVTPFAYSGYGHVAYSAPAYSAYSAYPYAGHAAHLYRHRRGVVTPFAYSGYGHATTHNTYSAFPATYGKFAHYY